MNKNIDIHKVVEVPLRVEENEIDSVASQISRYYLSIKDIELAKKFYPYCAIHEDIEVSDLD